MTSKLLLDARRAWFTASDLFWTAIKDQFGIEGATKGFWRENEWNDSVKTAHRQMVAAKQAYDRQQARELSGGS